MKNTPELILCELQPTGIPGLESHSPFCLKIHRALRAAGLSYTSRHADRPDAYRALNPTGQVPVLLVDGRPVADSTRILRELLRLAPDRIAESAEDWLWEELADTALNGFLVAARWADDANWPRVRDAYFKAMPGPVRAIVPRFIRKRVLGSLHARDVIRGGMDECWNRFRLLLDQLDARAPANGFWTGPAISVADLAIFGQLHGLRNELTPAQRADLAARQNLSAWLNRVDAATRSEVGVAHLSERRLAS